MPPATLAASTTIFTTMPTKSARLLSGGRRRWSQSSRGVGERWCCRYGDRSGAGNAPLNEKPWPPTARAESKVGIQNAADADAFRHRQHRWKDVQTKPPGCDSMQSGDAAAGYQGRYRVLQIQSQTGS